MLENLQKEKQKSYQQSGRPLCLADIFQFILKIDKTLYAGKTLKNKYL